MEYYINKLNSRYNEQINQKRVYQMRYEKLMNLFKEADIENQKHVIWSITISAIRDGINDLIESHKLYFDDQYPQQINQNINEDIEMRETREKDARGMRKDKYKGIVKQAGRNAENAVKITLNTSMDDDRIKQIGRVVKNMVEAEVQHAATKMERYWAWADMVGWEAAENLLDDETNNMTDMSVAGVSVAMDAIDNISSRIEAQNNMKLGSEWQTLDAERRIAAAREAARRASARAAAEAAEAAVVGAAEANSRKSAREAAAAAGVGVGAAKEAEEKIMDDIPAIYDDYMINSNSYNGGKKKIYKTRKARKIKKKSYKKNKKHKYKKIKQTIKKI